MDQQQEIRKRFDTLPQSLKTIIANLDMGTITDGLRQKYNLHVDQLGQIAEEITSVMVGLASVYDFNSKIKNRAGLTEDVANLITYDINQQIFLKIRKELEEISEMSGSTAPQIFDAKMTNVANVPKGEVIVSPEASSKARDPYRESM